MVHSRFIGGRLVATESRETKALNSDVIFGI